MSNWEDIQHGFQISAAGCAMVMHYILIQLIINHSPKSIGQYKYLMLLISIFEIIYAVLDVIVQPIFHSFGATFMLIVNLKNSHVIKKIWEVLAVTYCGFFGSSMAIFSIHYMYRYWVISGNTKNLNWFKGKRVFIWLIGPFSNGLIWALVGYFLCYPRKSSDDYLRESVKETLGLNIDRIVYFAPYFYEKSDSGQNDVYWPSFIGISLDSLSINISLGFVIYYGTRCWRQMNTIITSSSIMEGSLQNQLFYALVAQTAIPIFLMHIPALTMFMFSFFELDAGHLSGIVSMTIALFPALDPIPTILIISSYRNAVKDYMSSTCRSLSKPFRCLIPKKKSARTNTSSTH
ncbi:hypothetical protein CAEBREN_31828 [Caenorhabditis brenneri]|uniref:Serpentine receptor class r-10 n=1 Tax=Caenorhabditis brenneri TaxID=135651 RepID=G0MTQ5_CAEBE|nr:hypothetical protein CAEBREN_31828 [Caenorhabditis brenneri]